MQDAELPKLNKLKEEIKQSFNRHQECGWYGTLLNAIENVKDMLTIKPEDTPPSFMKHIYRSELLKYIEQIKVLSSTLSKEGHILYNKHKQQLAELANLYEQVYNAMSTFIKD